MKRPYLSLATLVIFSLYTAGTIFVADQSLIDFGLELISSPDTAQVVIDLYLLGVLACIWMYRDTRSKGRSAVSLVPYFLITAVFVSIGPLLYLVINGFAKKKLTTDGKKGTEKAEKADGFNFGQKGDGFRPAERVQQKRRPAERQ